MEATRQVDALERARVLLGARRYQEAAALAQRCASARPGDPQPLILCAWAEMGLRHFDAAEKAARDAVGFAPMLPEAHRVLVAVLTNRAYAAGPFAAGRAGRQAVRAAEEFVRLAPTDVAAYWTMADACVAAHKPRGAVAASETALSLAPNSPQTWLIRARAARAAYDFPVAEACIREALRLEPDHYLANTELGIILRLRGRTSEALQQLASSASIDPLARPARAHLLRYGALPFLFLTLVATSPILVVLHGATALWLWGSVGINAVMWRVEPTKRVLERRALAISLWRSRRPGRRSRRKEALVPATTPIQSYRSRLAVSISFLLLLLLIAGIVTGAAAQSAPALLPLTLLINVPTAAFAWFVFKRLRPRPTVAR